MRLSFLAALTCCVLVLPGSAAATDLLIFDTPAAPTVPPGATVRQLPEATIWIFANAADCEHAALDYPTATAMSYEGSTLLIRRADHETHRLATDSTPLWESRNFRIVGTNEASAILDLTGGCGEILRPMPRSEFASTGPPEIARTDPAAEADLVGSVREATYARYIRELSGDLAFDLNGVQRQIATRWALDPSNPDGIGLAGDYIASRFESWGYTVQRQAFLFPFAGEQTPAENIIAERTGTLYPDEILVVGAHFDARAEILGLPAPGAEDNASGVAAVLHLAELLSNWQPERTIQFVAFGAEEWGLYGSTYYVQQAIANNQNILGALTMDMISAWTTKYGILIEGETAWEWLMSALESNVLDWTDLTYTKSYHSFGSDHVPFQTANIPALLGIDLDWDVYAAYHTSADTFANVDTSLGTEITRAMAGTIADIAGLARKVDISERPPGSAPVSPRVQLFANRPNPFNPRTTLEFSIPEAGPTRLAIFDIKGRLVATVADEYFEAGVYQREWDGLDDSGIPVSSGTYLYRLEHPAGVLSRTMTLVR